MFQTTIATICLLCATTATAGIDRDVPKRVVQGDVRCRVLLIDFEGREHIHSREAFQKAIFGKNVLRTPTHYKKPMIGSARDYFSELSGGKVRLSGEVMPWVRSRLDPEKLPHWRKTHDGQNDWWHPVVSDAMSQNDIPRDDRINGKRVDCYIIIYAGPIDGYFKSLKKRQFMGAGLRGLSKHLFRKNKVPYWEDRWHGKRIIFCPERRKEKPSDMFGIGQLCHELGHFICHFRDLYGERNGDFGRWAIMGVGDKTHFPTGPTALHRYMAGWLAYDVPQPKGTHRIKLPPLQAKRAVKLLNGPMPWADSLIIENRVRLTPNHRTLPAEGLFIYEAYGQRQVTTVSWDKKGKKPNALKPRLRIVRADDTAKNPAGDAFRKGELSLFGKPSSASSATGCGFWKLDHIRVPDRLDPKLKRPPSLSNRVATFNATYCPRLLKEPKSDKPIELGPWLPPGDYRCYVEVAKGTCSLEGDDTLLQVTRPERAKPQWGLVDVHVTDEHRPLNLLPGPGSKIASAQVVERRPVLLDLLAKPHAEQLASGFKGKISASTPLVKDVSVGRAITIPVSKSASASVKTTCPGGQLRLALKASCRKRDAVK
ncbi:MAG: hypothetical protein PVH19_12280, partial [Planctomycetia bacterium]